MENQNQNGEPKTKMENQKKWRTKDQNMENQKPMLENQKPKWRTKNQNGEPKPNVGEPKPKLRICSTPAIVDDLANSPTNRTS